MVAPSCHPAPAANPTALYAPLRAWKRFQVSYYGGKYSIERVLALDNYVKRTSLSRVLLVCFGTPLPMIAIVTVQELIPLQDPSAGWRENYSFLIRAAVLAFITAHTITGQTRYLIDGAIISERQLVVLSACASAVLVICTMVTSAFAIFPFPFFVLTMAPMFYVLLMILFRVLVGGRISREMLGHSDQLIRYLVFVCAQIMVAFVYPIYEALFRLAEGTQYQLAVILLLPAIKVAVKNVLLRCTAHMEDMIPEAVIFTVDFFNAIYVATCMQSASSFAAVTSLTVADLLQTSIMLYGLHNRTTAIRSRLIQALCTASKSDNIVDLLCSLCRNMKEFKKQFPLEIHIRSCLPHRVSTEDSDLLDKLMNASNGSRKLSRTSAGPDYTRLSSRHNTFLSKKLRFICARKSIRVIRPVVPVAHAVEARQLESLNSCPSLPPAPPNCLQNTLEALFTSECLVLTAYLEFVVPFFYSGYMLMMVHLQNAKYHTEMKGITPQNVGHTVLPVFVFALLQLVSFVLLANVIKRNCGMQALYQLAFVLEAQMSLIQGKMMLWMVIIICFRVVHFG